MRWLNANKVDFVLIGSPALAIRGEVSARGPIAIVPLPTDVTSTGSRPRSSASTQACGPTA